ncbi:MAG: glycine cleavage system protein GcvH [Rhodocyclaceae bacterium]|nr:MAG: glycine cleavage system protein GcvH [Rhodocyclaceae bacterium]
MNASVKPAADLKYSASHEWTRQEADGTVTIGITDHAQEALGDIVFLELPAIGRVLQAGEECAVVESVKAASDIYAPVSGEVVDINQAAADTPESVNADAYAAWLFRVKPADPVQCAAELDGLLDAAAYGATL